MHDLSDRLIYWQLIFLVQVRLGQNSLDSEGLFNSGRVKLLNMVVSMLFHCIMLMLSLGISVGLQLITYYRIVWVALFFTCIGVTLLMDDVYSECTK